ncbi:MAG: DUF4221 family protein [Marinilabiliaceae bacterium]|nr:DUF4221 family protein [Marinilabiliaceae bacterium]
MRIICLLFLIVLTACVTKNHHENKRRVFEVVASNDILSIPPGKYVNEESIAIRYFKDDKKEYLALLNQSANEIIIYDLQLCQLSKRIKFERRGPERVGLISGFDMWSLDSIYLTSKTFYRSLFLVDSSSHVLRKLDFVNQGGESLMARIAPLHSHINNELIYRNSNLLVGTYIMGASNNAKLIDQPFRYIYDMKRDTCLGMVNYPKFSEDSDAQLGYYSGIGISNALIYSGVNEPNVYVNNGSKWKSYNIRSQYQENEITANYIGVQDINTVFRMMVETPKYLSFLTDKAQGVYYRFFYPGVSGVPDEDIQYFQRYHKWFTLMVINSKFEVVGETKLPDEYYNPNMAFVSEQGLYLSLSRKHPKYNDNFMCFERMLIKKVK